MLYVFPKPYEQSFTIEFGWSKLTRIPEVPTSVFALDTVATLHEKRIENDEYLQRVRIFFGEDKWWDYDSRDSTAAGQVMDEVGNVLVNRILPALDYVEARLAERKAK